MRIEVFRAAEDLGRNLVLFWGCSRMIERLIGKIAQQLTQLLRTMKAMAAEELFNLSEILRVASHSNPHSRYCKTNVTRLQSIEKQRFIGGNRIRPIETIHVTQKTDKSYHNSSPPLVRVLVPLRGEGSEGSSKRWRSAEARGVWGAVRCGLSGPTGCRLFHFQIEDCANALSPAEAGAWCLLNQGDERSGFPV